jgi:HAD superfamily hydrolase (TIGR01549 family)
MRETSTIDRRQLRGMIFDLDGTLVDSALDFEAIRRDMRLPSGKPILEALDLIPSGDEKEQMLSILHQHELAGAKRATLYDGVREFMEWLDRRKIRRAVLTRSSRESTEIVLNRLDLNFEMTLTREDAPPKPDPGGLLAICDAWKLPSADVLFCGDYLFDLEAGTRAGMQTVLFAPGATPDFAAQATYLLSCFHDATSLIDRHFLTARPT